MNRCGNSAGRKRSGKIARNWTVSLASANELLVPRLRSLFPTYEFSPCWLTVDWIGWSLPKGWENTGWDREVALTRWNDADANYYASQVAISGDGGGWEGDSVKRSRDGDNCLHRSTWRKYDNDPWFEETRKFRLCVYIRGTNQFE